MLINKSHFFCPLPRSRKENLHLSSEYNKLQESYKHLESLKVKLETSEVSWRVNLTDAQKDAHNVKQEVRGPCTSPSQGSISQDSGVASLESALVPSTSVSSPSLLSSAGEAADGATGGKDDAKLSTNSSPVSSSSSSSSSSLAAAAAKGNGRSGSVSPNPNASNVLDCFPSPCSSSTSLSHLSARDPILMQSLSSSHHQCHPCHQSQQNAATTASSTSSGLGLSVAPPVPVVSSGASADSVNNAVANSCGTAYTSSSLVSAGHSQSIHCQVAMPSARCCWIDVSVVFFSSLA